jgi:hypothetical protein
MELWRGRAQTFYAVEGVLHLQRFFSGGVSNTTPSEKHAVEP